VVHSGLLSAAARKKSTYRSAALAALHKVLVALQPRASTTSQPSAVDGSAVWGTVAPPLLEALQQQLAAASTAPAAASANGDKGAASADASDEVKPLPLSETCRWGLAQ
jgi:hypothetical protein